MSTAQYVVIGNPIAHSKSPDIHAAFALQTGQQIAYTRCLAPLDGFGATVRALIHSGCLGANVTLPFKLEAAALALSLSERAREAGAVNTLSFIGDDIVGDNTDGAGLVNDIVRNARVQIAGKRILLLGAGGAARGALLPLLREHPQEIVIANRTAATADALAAHFGARAEHSQQIRACAFDGLDALARAHDGPFDIVVNATSASIAATMPPVPVAAFGTGTLALDMMYARAPSVFMEFAASHGATARDGLGMLVEQAAEAFSLWRGVRPEGAPVLAQMRERL